MFVNFFYDSSPGKTLLLKILIKDWNDKQNSLPIYYKKASVFRYMQDESDVGVWRLFIILFL